MIQRYELKSGSVLSLVIAVIASMSRLSRFDIPGYYIFPISIAYTFGFSLLCWMILHFIIRQRIPAVPLNTLLVKCIFGMICCAAASLIYQPVNGSILSRVIVLQDLTRRQIAGALIFRGLTFGAVHLFLMYYLDTLHAAEQSRLENETLKRDNLQARMAALQQQISPHFLFNALNTIQTLAGEESVKQYTFQLASVYRYLLQYGKIVS